MDNPDTVAVCPECDGRLRNVDAETTCENCGLVVAADPIDRGPEWRSFDEETERKRTGAPLTRSRHDRGLSTKIGYGYGGRVKGRKRRQLARMRREHRRANLSTKADRNRAYGFTEIRRIVAALSLPVSVRDQSCTLFRSAQSENLLQGRSLEGFAAAAVYATCRTRDLARTLEEIVAIAKADDAELKAAYAALNRDLGLPTGPIAPEQYLPRYATKLGVDAAVQRKAKAYVSKLDAAGLVAGRNPSGVAAACLYTAASDHDDPVTQAAAAEVADVSPVTIRSTVENLGTLEGE